VQLRGPPYIGHSPRVRALDPLPARFGTTPASPFVPRKNSVRGFVYDVRDALLSVVW
jgi:hypothetical protein